MTMQNDTRADIYVKSFRTWVGEATSATSCCPWVEALELGGHRKAQVVGVIEPAKEAPGERWRTTALQARVQ
jgi:hypothetical protein